MFDDPKKYEAVFLKGHERFVALQNQTIDLFLRAARNMERDIMGVRVLFLTIFCSLTVNWES